MNWTGKSRQNNPEVVVAAQVEQGCPHLVKPASSSYHSCP